MLRIIRGAADAADFMSWLGERHDIVALDTETTGFDIRSADFRVRLVQIGDANAAWVIPIEWAGVVNEAIRKYEGRWAIHNAPYDIPALAREGIVMPWPKVDDTMIAMRLAEPTQPAALKEAAQRHVGAGANAGQADLHLAMKKQGWTWATIPDDFAPYYIYAGMDVVLTSRLWSSEVCQRRGIGSPVYGLEMQVLEICCGMSDRGIRVDVDYCFDQASTMRDEADEIAERLLRTHSLNVGSNVELARRFLELGAMITMTTPSGAPSVAKAQLDALKLDGNSDVRDLAYDVLRYRKLTKIAGSYLESFVELADHDGLVHASIETLAARTGRMSIRRPGLQTLPKPGESAESRVVRRAVIPNNDGDALISSDLNQIEMRLAGVESLDPGLIAAFEHADSTGEDFFAAMGAIVYREPDFQKSDPRRKIVKNTMYGMLYGAGPPKIAATAGITVDEARNARSSILSAFPGLERAMKNCEHEARSTGTVTTALGRVLEVDPDLAYKGLNAKIQGSAADYFKRGLVWLAQAGLDKYMILPVHDEVVFSMPRDVVEKARPAIARAMLVDDILIPVPAEPSSALERWGDDA